MERVIDHLSTAQLELARAVHASAGSMESRDEHELRAWLMQLPHMIARLEGKTVNMAGK